MKLPDFDAFHWRVPYSAFTPWQREIYKLAWHRAYRVPEETRASRSPGEIAQNFYLGSLGEVCLHYMAGKYGYDVTDLDFAIQNGEFEHRRDLNVAGREVEVKSAFIVDGFVSWIIPKSVSKRYDDLSDDTILAFNAMIKTFEWTGKWYDLKESGIYGYTFMFPKSHSENVLAEPYSPAMKKKFKAVYYNDLDKQLDIRRLFESQGLSGLPELLS